MKVVAILIIFVGLSGLESARAALPDFCSDAYTAICGEDGSFGKQYDARFAVAKASVRARALVRLASEYGFAPATDAALSAYLAAHPATADAVDADLKRQLRL